MCNAPLTDGFDDEHHAFLVSKQVRPARAVLRLWLATIGRHRTVLAVLPRPLRPRSHAPLSRWRGRRTYTMLIGFSGQRTRNWRNSSARRVGFALPPLCGQPQRKCAALASACLGLGLGVGLGRGLAS